MIIFLSLAVIFLLVLAIEIWWRKGKLKPELARKIIHLVAGTSIAFWPFFMSWRTIQLLSLALLVGVFLSNSLKIFGSIHSVKRSTKGEIIYPLSIGLCALIEPAPWIFTAAILHLAIADGLAAIVGTKWGKKTHYKLGPHQKSLIGTGVFFLTSLTIISASFVFFDGEDLLGITPITLLAIAGVATLVENISWYGWDNLTVPVAVILLLSAV